MGVLSWEKHQQTLFERECLWFLTYDLKKSFGDFKVDIITKLIYDESFMVTRVYIYVSVWPGHRYLDDIEHMSIDSTDEMLMKCAHIGEEAAIYFNSLTIAPEPHHILGEN